MAIIFKIASEFSYGWSVDGREWETDMYINKERNNLMQWMKFNMMSISPLILSVFSEKQMPNHFISIRDV